MNSPANPLLDKADALIRRHRTFVASPQESAPEAPPLQAAPNTSDEDIPLLTEIVDSEMARHTRADIVVNSALTDQQRVIRAAIERWVDERLPDAILHVLDGFTDRLIAAVSERARSELLASLDHDLPPSREGPQD